MADGITVKLEGVEDLIRKVRSYQVIKKEAVRIALVRGALKVELAAKEMCTEMGAVDTGRLRGSITTDKRYIQKFLVRIGTNVDYGIYVEFGTKKMDARPYLFPAFFMFEGEIIKDIKKILGKHEGLR